MKDIDLVWSGPGSSDRSCIWRSPPLCRRRTHRTLIFNLIVLCLETTPEITQRSLRKHVSWTRLRNLLHSWMYSPPCPLWDFEPVGRPPLASGLV